MKHALAGLTAALAAATAAASDLDTTYQQALERSPGYQAARAEFAAAAEAQPQALARLMPQVGVRGEVDWVRQEVEGDYFGFRNIDRSDSFDRMAYGVALRQAVFRRELLIGLDEAELELVRARVLLEAAEDELAVAVAESYFAVLAAQDNLALSIAESDALRRQLEQTRDRARSGIVTDADHKRVQAQADLAEAERIEAENNVAVARATLESLTGAPQPAVKTLPQELVLPPPPLEPLAQWETLALHQNQKLIAQQISADYMKLEQAKAESRRWPTLDVVAGHVWFDTDGGISGAREDLDQRVGLEVNLPLFTGGLLTAQAREALERHRKSLALVDEARDEALRRTRVAYLNTTAGVARLDALRRAVESAQASEEAARVGYDVGARTMADVLLAARERLRARRDLSRARYEYLLSGLRLKAAAGSLTPTDLALINRWLR